MASRKNSTRTPKKLDPRAEEALKTRDNLLLAYAYAETPKPPKVNHNKGKVKVKDEHGTVETKPCRGTCDDCSIRFKCWSTRNATLTEDEWREADVTKGTGKILSEWKDVIDHDKVWDRVSPARVIMPFWTCKRFGGLIAICPLPCECCLERFFCYTTVNKIFKMSYEKWRKEYGTRTR